MIERTGTEGSPAMIIREGSPPQRSHHKVGRQIAAGNAERRIDAALEAIAGVGDDAEFAACLGDVRRIPERALNQHVDRAFVATGMLAAHDAGDRFNAVAVGDDDRAFIQFVSPRVEREQALAFAGSPDCQVAYDLTEVEDM